MGVIYFKLGNENASDFHKGVQSNTLSRFLKHEGHYLRSEEVHYVAIVKRGNVAMRQKLIKDLADLKEITD